MSGERRFGPAWAALLAGGRSAFRAGRGAALGALALFALISCILEGEKTAKRGSEVENEIHGVLVAVNGDPVQGAEVKAVPSQSVLAKPAAGVSDSVLTDSSGRYVFRGLSPGRYNLLGSYREGSLVVLIPDVERSDTAGRLDLGIDTLRTPGGIRSRILLGDKGRVGVLCYVPGTSNLAVSDDSGWCLLDKVPQGRYTVRYSASGFVIAPDTGVPVVSGRVTELGTKILAYDPELPPPAPQNLAADFDPYTQRVTLAWSRVGVSDLDGYVVYRDIPGAVEPQPLPDGLATDTSFTDTVAGIGPDEIRRFVYRVKARDREANLSLFSRSASVEAYHSRRVTTTLAWTHSRQALDTAIVGDTLALALSYSNPTRLVRSVEWYAGSDADGNPLRIRLDSALAGSDTLRWRAGIAGKSAIRAQATDETGKVWALERSVVILPDALLPLAGRDTSVSIGDSVLLRAGVVGRPSRVIRWEWDLGMKGLFREGREGGFGIRAPDTAGDFPCVLRITGSNGLSAQDTVLVRVIQDPPVADAGPDRLVDARDTLRIIGAATDDFGRIVKWEWREEGDSAFSEGAQLTAPMSRDGDSLARFILRVTDDDGNADSDTVAISIRYPAFQVDAGADRIVSIKDSVVVTAMGQGGRFGIAGWEWDIGARGYFRPAGAGAFGFRAPDTADRILCILRLTDTRGDIRLDTAVVTVLLDPPSVTLTGSSNGGTILDTVKMTAQGRDGKGTVVAYAWDLGATGTFVPGRQDTLFRLPILSRDSLYPVVVRAEDDDGLFALDTAFVFIALGKPRANLFKEPWIAGFNGDSVRYHGYESQDFPGRIVKWEWDIDGSGFQAGGPETTLVLPPNAPNYAMFNVSLRITDDDGLMDTSVYNIITWERGGGTWVGTAFNPDLYTRRDAAAAEFNGYLWLIGGHTRGSENADVWRLGGGAGAGIERVDSGKGFSPRSMHRVLVHAGRMWVIGGSSGLSDVWSTADGLSWTRVAESAPFGPRAAFAAYVFQGRMWVVGGGSDAGGTRYYNDVWSSSDGSAWTQETPAAAFSPRRHAGYFELDGKLWLTGGETGGSGQSEIWNSPDGITWTRAGDLSGLVDSLAGHSHLVNDGKVWMLRGSDVGGPALLQSSDGLHWSPVSGASPYTSRSRHASAIFKRHMFSIGGTEPPGGPNPYGDVIYSR